MPSPWPKWPQPHSCDWCRSLLLDFRGSKKKDVEGAVTRKEVNWREYSFSATGPSSRKVQIPMFVDSCTIQCGELLVDGAKRSCILAQMILEKLGTPELNAQSNIILVTGDGKLTISNPFGKSIVFTVDTLSGTCLNCRETI